MSIGESVLKCGHAGGCGFIGPSSQFHGDGDFVFCPCCNQDWATQVCDDNFEQHTKGLSDEEKAEVKDLVDQYYGRKQE